MIDFQEEGHKYTRNGTHYISVTQLIDRYVKPYDSQYWSLYKAIKDVLENQGLFREYKFDKAGSWKNVVSYFEDNHTGNRETDLLIYERQQWYLNTWQEKNEKSCVKGSKTHKQLEDAVNHARVVAVDSYNMPVDKSSYIPLREFESNGIWTEPYIWSDTYQVAGKADVIIKIGRRIRLKDYKTNEEITTEAFNGQCLLAPIDHVPDTKYNRYCLQLSLYGLMLEDWGYRVEDLELIHIKKEGDFPMKVHYLKDEARDLLENHKSQIMKLNYHSVN